MKWTRGGSAREEKGLSLTPRGVLLLLAGALVLAYFGGWWVMGGRVAREIERLRRQGEPLRPSELLPKFAPGEKNAADIYERAFAIEPSAALDPFNNRIPAQWTATETAAAGTVVAGNKPYFDLLARATRIEKCSFSIDWDDPTHVEPQTARLRRAAWAVRLEAGVRAHQGDGDGALARETEVARMAFHAQQIPVAIGSLLGGALDGILFRDLPFLLDAGRPSPAACRALSQELAKQDPAAALVRGLRGDRAAGLQLFAAMEAGRDLAPMLAVSDPPSRLEVQALRAYPHVGKPVWYRDKGVYLEVMRDAITAAGQPWPENDRQMAAISTRFQGLGGKTSIFTGRFASSLDRLSQDADRAIARLHVARVALALKVYQGEHGQYPASLAALASTKLPLPLDPFTGKALHYRRERSGFTLWSTGPDMVDNKGAARMPGGPQRAPKGGYVSGCDCTMQCTK